MAFILDATVFGDSPQSSQVIDFKIDSFGSSSYQSRDVQHVKEEHEALSEQQSAMVQSAIQQANELQKPIRLAKKQTGLSYSITVTPDGHLYVNLKEKLGKGAVKTVTKVIDLTNGKIFAKKSCPYFDDKEKAELIGEYEMASRLQSGITSMPLPNTLRINETETKLIYFEELMHNGDLATSSHLIAPWNLLSCARQMASLVARFHQNGILHRDIKPANFFIKSVINGVPDLRLGDLGEAVRVSESERKKSYAGTETTWSPEYCRAFLVKQQNPDGIGQATTDKADSWQLGMSMLIGFNGHLGGLINHSNSRELINEIVGKTSAMSKMQKIEAVAALSDENWLQRPQEGTIEFVIYNLLRVNPEERWTAQQASDYLESLQPSANLTFYDLIVSINTWFVKFICAFTSEIHRIIVKEPTR